MPGQTPRVIRGWDSQISRQSAHEGGMLVSPMHRPPLPLQEIFLVLISVGGWVDPWVIVRLEGLLRWKIPMTPSGIEPATYWLVAQCLNHLHHRVPPITKAHLFVYLSIHVALFIYRWFPLFNHSLIYLSIHIRIFTHFISVLVICVSEYYMSFPYIYIIYSPCSPLT